MDGSVSDIGEGEGGDRSQRPGRRQVEAFRRWKVWEEELPYRESNSFRPLERLVGEESTEGLTVPLAEAPLLLPFS